MVDFRYLQTGLWGLANAHQAGTMAGHLGAAVVTGYFIGEVLPELPDAVYRGVERELDRIVAGEEAIWFDAEKAGITPQALFKEFPQAPAAPESIQRIADALVANGGALKQSGHNTIFASIALRALLDHHDLATEAMTAGIARLIAAFDQVGPGRGYYGKPTGWLAGGQVAMDETTEFPRYGSVMEMVETTINELTDSAAIRKQGFGGLWHIINHAAAIVELDRYGFSDAVANALSAHHQHMRLWRTLPDVSDELGAVVAAEHDPLSVAYWEGPLKRDGARLTHRIKTLFGFHTLLRLIDDAEARAAAQNAFRFLMD